MQRPFHPAPTIELNDKTSLQTLTGAEKDHIRHYVKHGDSKCSKCISGFRIYWAPSDKKAI